MFHSILIDIPRIFFFFLALTTLVFIYPNFDEPFVLTTDANTFAIGAVLSQRPIGILCQAESKYSTIKRELLTIVWSFKHFRTYLYGKIFKLVMDYRSITRLFSIKYPGSRTARRRLKRIRVRNRIRARQNKQERGCPI